MLYALILKGTDKLLGFDVESNNGDDFCVPMSYELSEYSDRIWTTSSKANAIAVANSTSEYYHADYDSPINKYIGRLEIVEVTIGNLINI
jgi:hypothetical protein